MSKTLYICEQCHNQFFSYNVKRFCTLPCYWQSAKRGHDFVCVRCHAPFRSTDKTRKYCSHFCHAASMEKKYSFICPECQHAFQVNVQKRVYCSAQCKKIAQSKNNIGENNPNWKPTKELKYTVRHALRRRIKARDKVCQECGSPECLQVHHLDGNHSNNDESNLILLCANHHAAHHRARGEHAIARLILNHYLCRQNKGTAQLDLLVVSSL